MNEEKKAILKQRAVHLATREESPSSLKETSLDFSHIKIIEFLLAHERFGIESNYVKEIVPLKEYTRIPCTPPFVLGIANIRGEINSVVNLKTFFDLPETGITDLNRLIVLESEKMRFGMVVDSILGMTAISTAEIFPPPPTLIGIRADFLKGITQSRTVILDGKKLLSDRRMTVHEEVKEFIG